jgi:hypothetical protein
MVLPAEMAATSRAAAHEIKGNVQPSGDDPFVKILEGRRMTLKKGGAVI